MFSTFRENDSRADKREIRSGEWCKKHNGKIKEERGGERVEVREGR